jgi:carbonic anhydrase
MLAAMMSLSAKSPVAQEHAAPHWSYAGKDGPEHWAELDKAFGTCQVGQRQSPIDIRASTTVASAPIQFAYRPAPMHIVNNGHTIQLNYAPGSFITVGNQRYQLVQFHFHHPSEERINGKSFEMVAHLVHASAEGKLAVVAVLLDTAAEDPATANIWGHLPAHEGPEEQLDNLQIDATSLLPKDRGYFTFMGSLTTPPCSEDVTWFVLKATKHISSRQAAAFASIYPNNARPIQPLNGREVRASK